MHIKHQWSALSVLSGVQIWLQEQPTIQSYGYKEVKDCGQCLGCYHARTFQMTWHRPYHDHGLYAHIDTTGCTNFRSLNISLIQPKGVLSHLDVHKITWQEGIKLPRQVDLSLRCCSIDRSATWWSLWFSRCFLQVKNFSWNNLKILVYFNCECNLIEIIIL